MNKQEFYRITFGYENSKYYQQAVEVAKLAEHYKTEGSGKNIWHTIRFTEKEIDLMAFLFKLAKRLSRQPNIYGVNAFFLILYCQGHNYFKYARLSEEKINEYRKAINRLKQRRGDDFVKLLSDIRKKYVEEPQKDWLAVIKKLEQEGYYEPNMNGNIETEKKPQEPVLEYRQIRDLIVKKKYKQAINWFYFLPKEKLFDQLHNELIYLKRLAKIAIEGRDILFLKNESNRSDLVKENLFEYEAHVNKVLRQMKSSGMKPLLDIIIEHAPTMEEKVAERKRDWRLGVYLWDGKFKRDTTPVTNASFSAQYDQVPYGRFFKRYPDQIKYCGLIKVPVAIRRKGLWTTYSPDYIKGKIINKGLHLNGIEAYSLQSLGSQERAKNKVDFTIAESINQVEKRNYGVEGIEYTGRTHEIERKTFYEINLLREDFYRKSDAGNIFLDTADEIFREAENILREQHGLPKIGEGWISEMQLFRLIKKIFSSAQHHATPDWLTPQHLDVFVPSQKLAFEYQGRQHFESIEFFGGEEALKMNKKRDNRKKRKCKQNQVRLIYWRYDEKINRATLSKKLESIGL